MKTKGVGVFLLSGLLIVAAGPRAGAQSTIEPEKRALIEEFLALTKAKERASMGVEMMLQDLERANQQMVETLAADATDEEQKQMKDMVAESQKKFNERFRQLYKEKIDLNKVIEQVYVPLYDKYFTKDELKELIAFYRSPTGQKAVEVMPDITQEAMQKVGEIVNPKILEIVDQIFREQRQELEEKTGAQGGGRDAGQ